MANPFTVTHDGQTHTVFVVSLETPSYSDTEQYDIFINREDNGFIAYCDKKSKELYPDRYIKLLSDLERKALSEITNQPEYPYSFAGLDRSVFPLPQYDSLT